MNIDSAQEVPKKKSEDEIVFVEILSNILENFERKTNLSSLKQMTNYNDGISLLNNLLHSVEQFAIKFEELKTKSSIKIPLHHTIILISNDDDFYLLNRTKDPENKKLINLKNPKNTDEDIDFESIDLTKFLVHSLKVFTEDHYNFIERIKSHWFWGILWRNRSSYSQSGLASIMVNVFAITTAMFTMIVYNKIIPANAIDSLIVLVSGVAVIILVDLITRSIRSNVLSNSGIDADELIADNLFEQIVDMKTNTAKMNVGSMASTMREFEQVREFFTSATLLSLFDLPFALFFIFIIWVIGGAMVYPIIIGCAILITVAFISNKLIKKASEASFQQGQKKHSVLIETLNGLETIKSTGAQSIMRKKWLKAISNQNEITSNVKKRSNLVTNLSQVMTSLLQVSVVTVGVFLVREGEYGYGAIIACTILLGKVIAPISQLVQILSRVNQLITGYKALNELMNQPRDHNRASSYVPRENFKGSIQFKDLEFKYPDTEKLIVDKLTNEIKPGEKVAIIGSNGSGKTTLARLILRLYEPTAGAMYFDGIDSRQIDPIFIRSQIGYVPQDPWIITGSVKDNLSLGNDEIVDDLLIWAGKTTGINRFIDANKDGYNMYVGEKGGLLSGGQKQALTIARAVIRKPKILLLDEPTSAMDQLSEKNLITNLFNELKDTTVIFITHRPSVLEFVDRILVLKDGKVFKQIDPKKTKQSPSSTTTNSRPEEPQYIYQPIKKIKTGND